MLRGECLYGRSPGPSEHEVVRDVHGALAVLAGGVDVASDVEPVLGDIVAGQATGDLLLRFQRAHAALGLMLFVGQRLVFPVKRSTSSLRSLQNSSRSRPGFCFELSFGPGTLASQARTACRNSYSSGLSAVLAELAAGQRPLTHAALDELPDSKTLRHLRSVLVATGALPPGDEHMIRLEHWIAATIAGRDDPGERQLLHRYATWHALRRLRRRAGSQHVTHGQAITVQRYLRAAITLLDWLTARGLGLAQPGRATWTPG